jgi:hypothetical protein
VSERLHVLDDLGAELERAARRVLDGEPGGPPERAAVRTGRGRRAHASLPAPRRRAAGRISALPRASGRLGTVLVTLALLLAAAAATAAVLLIQQGSSLPAPHDQDLRAAGIPLPGSAHLAGLDAPDPESSQPPWDLRLSRTRNGETCTTVGQVLDGRFGIVGLDHVFRALPQASVDSCGIDTGAGPVLVGAHEFVGATPAQALTVVSGVAGSGARAVKTYAAGVPARSLKLGPQGSFITIYAGEAEQVRPRVVVTMPDGATRTIALEQSQAFEVPDPEGGSGWAVSSEPDLEAGAYADEYCVQASREPSQGEPSFVNALTPEVCGRLGSTPVVLQMRRFVPGEDGRFVPWGSSPARTIVYGVAAPRVQSLSLSGAGGQRALAIDRDGGAFAVVLDGHVDPRSLRLTATLADGDTMTFTHASKLYSPRGGKTPLASQPVPAYGAPAPSATGLAAPVAFELPIAASVRETLRARDPAGGPEWVLRSWRGTPNPHLPGAGTERDECAALGVLWHGTLVEPSATPSASSAPLTAQAGRCNRPAALRRMHGMVLLEGFLDDLYEYAPRPERAVLSGVLPPGATDAVVSGLGSARPLRLDANGAFMLVLAGRYWDARASVSYVLDGRRVGRIAAFSETAGGGREPTIVRAPDPDGAAPWGFVASASCATAIGRVVDGRLASIQPSDGVITPGAEISGSAASCLSRPGPLQRLGGPRDEPVQFDEQRMTDDELAGGPPPLGRPEVEFRSLPGRTIISGVARADVASVTLSTPSEVRTLRPSGPLHAILAVYAGYFLRGAVTATIRLYGGGVVRESLPRAGSGSLGPVTLAERLRVGRLSLELLHERERLHPNPGRTRSRQAAPIEAEIVRIRQRIAYVHAHPGLLPAE